MPTIRDIRLQNLRLLIDRECGGVNNRMAQRLGLQSGSHISQMLRGTPTPGGTPRGMGDDLARKIEKAFAKPEGWMDAEHPPAARGQLDAGLAGLSDNEKQLVLLAREFGFTDTFVDICLKHLKAVATGGKAGPGTKNPEDK